MMQCTTRDAAKSTPRRRTRDDAAIPTDGSADSAMLALWMWREGTAYRDLLRTLGHAPRPIAATPGR